MRLMPYRFFLCFVHEINIFMGYSFLINQNNQMDIITGFGNFIKIFRFFLGIKSFYNNFSVDS